MTLYTFKCEECSKIQEEFFLMEHRPASLECSACGGDMYRTFQDKYTKVGDYEHTSMAMQVPVGNVKEHYKRFPNIELDSLNCPKFTSVKDHERYATARGVYKKPSRTK